MFEKVRADEHKFRWAVDSIHGDKLKFPQEFQNVGLTAERFTVEKISIGSPDDALYMPRVRPAD